MTSTYVNRNSNTVSWGWEVNTIKEKAAGEGP